MLVVGKVSKSHVNGEVKVEASHTVTNKVCMVCHLFWSLLLTVVNFLLISWSVSLFLNITALSVATGHLLQKRLSQKCCY